MRAVVIRGEGGVFCSGADLKYIRDGGSQDELGYLQPETRKPDEGYGEIFKQILEYIHSTISEIRRAPKPFIAAVDGPAAAGGFGIAMSCDLVVASERAWFEWAYFKTGLTGAESSTFFLPRLVGLRKALELVLLNPRLTARDALDWGLINRVVPDGSLDAEALKIATELAESPTAAVGVAKNLLNQAAGMDRLDVHLDAELTVQYQAGINHQFNDFLAATFAVYNRDIYGLISAIQVTDEATGNILARYINQAYGNARGVELTLDRRMHNRWSFSLNYTYAFADGVASDSAFGANPNGLEFLPNQELPLRWDQRHAVAMSLRVAEPNVWATSVTFDYGSGFPWTPFFRFERRQDPLLENSERFPATYSLNLQAERNVNFYGQRLVLYLQGRNLLNEDSVQTPQANLTPAPNLAAVAGTSYLTETGKYGNAYLIDVDGDKITDFVPMNDPRVFAQHRLFRVGLGWFF